LSSADPYIHVRNFASKQRERLHFDSRGLKAARNEYVAWIDLMGAGHIMSVSVARSANYLARLHMAVDVAAMHAPAPVSLNPINDGVFVTTPSKAAIMSVVREVLYTLGAYFISTGPPPDKCLLRAAIAFGPVYHGSDLAAGLSGAKRTKHRDTFTHVQFGPPIIQAYKAESDAPPYGVAIHESARAFAPEGEFPFRQTHWLWWTTLTELPRPEGMVSLPDLARCLSVDLLEHFAWMERTAMFQGLPREKIKEWAERVTQYFSVG
jgi:hypothetical protein